MRAFVVGFTGGVACRDLEPLAVADVAALCSGGFGCALLLSPDGRVRVLRPSGGAVVEPSSPPLFATHVAAGYDHAAAATRDGELRLWGVLHGASAPDAPQPVSPSAPALPTRLAVAQLSCGERHTLVLTRDGAVWEVTNGGEAAFLRLPPGAATRVAAGARHSLAALAGAAGVAAWGESNHGQCGRGDALPATASASPSASTPSQHTTDAVAAASLTVPALRGVEVVSVAAGVVHSACLTNGGDVYVWGSNAHGQLGVTDDDGASQGGRAASRRAALTPVLVESLRCVVSLSAGAAHTLALVRAADAGGVERTRVVCWGRVCGGGGGVCGDDDEETCVAQQQPRELSLPPGAGPPRAIASGWWHALVLTD